MSNESADNNNPKNNKNPLYFIKSLSIKQVILITTGILLFTALLVASSVAVDYYSTPRVASISATTELDARGGKITIKYANPTSHILYSSANPRLYVSSELSKDQLTETHVLIAPTRYSASYQLHRRTDTQSDYALWGLFRTPEAIRVTTEPQPVSLKGMIPAENTRPAVETLNNQLILQFNHDIIGKYKLNINIPISEMDFVKLTPDVKGYYRWSNKSTLTFNFSESKPQHGETYHFDIFPDQIIDSTSQRWKGTTKVELTTAINEVYVDNFSLNNEIRWQDTLQIDFSGNMVSALDVLKKKSQDVVPVKITPAAGGIWTWTNARTLKFYPDNKLGWPIRKVVKVSIQPEINTDVDRKWRNGEKPEEFTFYVKPRQQSIQSYNLHGNSVKLEDEMTIKFSRPVIENEDVRNSISNTYPANTSPPSNIPFIFTPHIKGEFYWPTADRLKFKPDNLWSELTNYSVKLNPEFNPDKRYEWVGTTRFQFKTVENIVNTSFYLTPETQLSASEFFSNKTKYKNYNSNIAPESRLWILFDADLGSHIKPNFDMNQAVKITPPVKGTYNWLSNRLLEFVPDNNWPESSTTTIHITESILHHPEQHFVKDQNTFKFNTSKNIVRLPQLVDKHKPGPVTIKQEPNRNLVLQFSKNMNVLSEIGKSYPSKQIDVSFLPVTLTPELDFSFIWKNRRELIITPTTYWKPETEYRATLNKKTLPQKESKFEYDGNFNIKTEKNYVHIKKLTPQGRVGRRVIIDAEFNRNIRPSNNKIGTLDTTGLFKITPEIAGRWTWLADNKIQFKPAETLKTSTAYKILFDPDKITDKQFSWKRLSHLKSEIYAKEEYRMHTQALHVKQSNARFDFNKDDLLKQRFYLDIELSLAVNEQDLRKHFSIWYQKTDGNVNIQVPLIYTVKKDPGESNNQIQKFSVISEWIDRPSLDRRIYYTITKDIMPVEGNLGLQSTYTGDFLQEKPKNISLQGIQWKWKDGAYQGIISINAPVEPVELKKFLHIYLKDKKLKYSINIGSSRTSGRYTYELIANFKPGQTYNFKLPEGMLAADGAFTAKEINVKYVTPDLPGKLKFAFKGNILSQKDLVKVPLLITNITQQGVHISIDKIYANNINHFINNDINSTDISSIAKRIHSRHYPIDEITGEYIHNEEVIAHIDMSELFNQNRHGLFRINIGENNWSHNDSRWFLSTDIGLIARRFNNHILIWANSLHSQDALEGAEVLIYDKWNQVIGNGKTGAEGFIKLTYPADDTPTHVIVKLGDDFSFIDLAKHRESLAGYDIEGLDSKTSNIRSFIYSDRGVYRPGDLVHLVAVTRGRNGVLPEEYPISFHLRDPSGKETVMERFKLDKQGTYIYDYNIPGEAKTGKWTASVQWNNKQTGHYTFQVEEFIPNKIKVELEVLNDEIHSGDLLKLKVKANNLFGPPASGRKVTGSIRLLPGYFKPEGFSSYKFGHDENKFQRIDYELAESRLDENGFYVYEYRIPDNIDSPIGVNASYSATVIDDGGRGVTNYGTANVLLFSQYVGIKKLTDKITDLNSTAGFEVVNVHADGTTIPETQQELVMRVYRNKSVTHYRKNERGYFRYVTEKQRILVEELNDPRDKYGKFTYKPRYSGEHVLEVEDKVGKQLSRFNFYVAGEQNESIIQSADKIRLRVLTKKAFVNKQIKLEIKSPFKGKMLLIGERENVIFTRILYVDKNTRVVNINVGKEYLPNFYISAFVIQPVEKGSKDNPIYATGLLNVNVKDPEQSPKMKLVMKKQVSPNSEFSVNINIEDTNQSDMYFTVAAVDVGILDLTKFKTPEMNDYFNQKRRLEVTHLNMYPMVMPYMPDIKHIIDPSGAAPSRSLIKKKRVNPDSQQRVKSMALWSGLQKIDANGQATIKFRLPDFEGTMRVMVVAHGNQRFASKQQNVVIRDKLVIKPTLPRFLSTGDSFNIPVKLFNSTEISGDVEVSIQVSDHIKLQGSETKTVYLNAKGEKGLSFPVKVGNETGLSEIRLLVKGVGEQTHKTITIPVRTPGTLITLAGSGSVHSGSPQNIKMPVGFINGSQQYAMRITPAGLTKYQGSLNYLLRYPHGCLEQTTSKVFPLLYFSELVSHTNNKNTSRHYVREGIKKIQRMQLPDGHFSYWEGSRQINNWAFVYASHFIVEAQKLGYKINEKTWKKMISQLKETSSIEMSSSKLHNKNYGVTHQLYTLYVLALANENVISKLNYIYDNFNMDLRLHDKARLAAAFAASGELVQAKKIMRSINNFSEYDNPYRNTGGSFSSNVRDLSMLLDGFLQVDPDSEEIPEIIKQLTHKVKNGRWATTQDNAFAFLAIGRAIAKKVSSKPDGKAILGDGTVIPLEKELILGTPELLKGDVRIDIKGKGEVNFFWEAIGIEKEPKSLQQDSGVQIRRRYLDKIGEPVKLNEIRQGDLVVVELTIKSLFKPLENMVITDLLPMGLEIENARLSTSATLPWIKQSVVADYIDIRDDRINIFLTVKPDEQRYYFTTRAVTTGKFTVPPVRIEAMYDPEIFSQSDLSQMLIQAVE